MPSWVFPDDRTWPLAGLALLVAALWMVSGARPVVLPVPGLRLTAAGGLSLLVVTGVVLAGDRLSAARGPHLPREVANRELRAVLLRLESGHPGPGDLALRTGGPAPPDPVRLVYEAEHLPGQGYRHVEDPSAGNGLARMGGLAGGYLVFGPYEVLPGGAYRANFRVRPEPGSGPGPLGRLEVPAAQAQIQLADREVRREDLAPDGYRDLGLDFALPARAADLEWRIRLEQPGALRVDRITVLPLGRLGE